MHLSWTPFISVALVLATAVLAMIVWRKVVANREDDSIHVLEDAAMVPQQEMLAHKLEVIDKWGKLLTAVTAGYMVVLGVVYLYLEWVKGTTAGM